MQNNLVFLRHQLYKLKQEYCSKITIYRQIISETNLKTGSKNITLNRYEIRNAVVLPIRFETKMQYSAAYLKAGREFAYGAYLDQDMKNIIIDGWDLPTGFEIIPEDFVIYKNNKYEIVNSEKLEEFKGYQLTVKRLVGAPVNEIHEFKIYQSLRFLQRAVDAD